MLAHYGLIKKIGPWKIGNKYSGPESDRNKYFNQTETQHPAHWKSNGRSLNWRGIFDFQCMVYRKLFMNFILYIKVH